jgi:hypothetical protein
LSASTHTGPARRLSEVVMLAGAWAMVLAEKLDPARRIVRLAA